MYGIEIDPKPLEASIPHVILIILWMKCTAKGTWKYKIGDDPYSLCNGTNAPDISHLGGIEPGSSWLENAVTDEGISYMNFKKRKCFYAPLSEKIVQSCQLEGF